MGEGVGRLECNATVICCSEGVAPAIDEHRLVSVHGGCVKLEANRAGLTDTVRRRGARASCARGGPSTQGQCAAIRTLRMMATATLLTWPSSRAVIPWQTLAVAFGPCSLSTC